MSLTESIVEDVSPTWFWELGYAVGHGPQMAPGEPAAERDLFGEVALVGRLREAIRRLNPGYSGGGVCPMRFTPKGGQLWQFFTNQTERRPKQ